MKILHVVSKKHRGEPLIDIQPDAILDREWHEPFARIRVSKRGWSWVIQWPDADEYVEVIIGEAETYEQALADALARVRPL